MNQPVRTRRHAQYAANLVVKVVKDERIFYLIGGPNGSGKSTLRKRIVGKNPNLEVLDLDDIAATQKVSNITAARQLLKEDLPRVLSSGHSFVLESTLSGTYDTRIIKMAHNLEYKVVFNFVFLDSVEQNIERIKQRVAQGGHDVPIGDVRRRYEKSLHNFRKIAPMAEVDEWTLFYNGGNGEPQKVASSMNRIITVSDREDYGLFHDNCFDVAVRRLINYVELGADEARLLAEEFPVRVTFSAIEKILDSKQR